MLIEMTNTVLRGIRMYDRKGLIIFTTEGKIESPYYRDINGFKLFTFELEEGERIIQIRFCDA